MRALQPQVVRPYSGWTVAALAVVSGQTGLRFVNIATVQKITAVTLLDLATYTAWSAFSQTFASSVSLCPPPFDDVERSPRPTPTPARDRLGFPIAVARL